MERTQQPKESPIHFKRDILNASTPKTVGKDYQIEPLQYGPDTYFSQFLQSCAYLVWIFCLVFNLVCLPLLFVYSVIFVPFSRPFILFYVGWMVYDQKSSIYGRRWPLFIRYARYNPLWDHLTAYFKGQLVKTAELDPTRKYIFGYGPHGVYGMGLFSNIVFSSNFLKLFPGIETLTCTLPANFWFPGWRDFALLLGCASCEAESLKYRIKNGNPGTAMVIVIGGAEEFRYMSGGSMDLVLLKRKGFVKIALTTGADLVPVIGFGENEIFQRITHPFFEPLHKLFHYTFKCSAPLFLGKEWLVFPKRHSLVTVVGKPIRVQQTDNPTKEQIDILHEKYIQSLFQLYDEYKDIFHTYRTQEMRLVK